MLRPYCVHWTSRDMFLSTVTGTVPKTALADVMGVRLGKPITLDELQKFLLQLEASRDPYPRRGGSARREDTRPSWQQSENGRCHRCDGAGHAERNCRYRATKQWFRYICRVITKHKSADCFHRHRYVNNRNNYDHFTHSHNTRGREII